MPRLLLCIALILLALCVISCGGGLKPRAESSGADGLADQETQEKRRKAIDILIEKDVFKRLGPDAPELVVGPKWYDLDFDDKLKIASVAATYYFKVPRDGKTRSDELLVITDGKTGKSVGSYGHTGLHLD